MVSEMVSGEGGERIAITHNLMPSLKRTSLLVHLSHKLKSEKFIFHSSSKDKKFECAFVITKAPPFGGAYLNSDCAADLFHKILHAGSMGG